MIKRSKLVILEARNKEGVPSLRNACSPVDVRRQIYTSIPNQLDSLEAAVRALIDRDNKKSHKVLLDAVKKRLKEAGYGIKRLDNAIDYVVNKKLPKLYKKSKRNANVRKIISDNKKLVATACAYIKHVEKLISRLSRIAGIDDKPVFGFCSGRYDSFISEDPVGFSIEKGPSQHFINKWMRRVKSGKVLKRLKKG